jgi:hypothetical protein
MLSRPFQILQEKDSVETYGLHCDRLVMMILCALSSQSSSTDVTVGRSDVKGAHTIDEDTVPNEEAALSLQASYTQQRASSRKTLSLLWKTPPAVTISNPLPPHSYQNFQDRLGSMERSLSKLNNTVSLIARALLPSTAAPQGILPGL